MTHSFGVTSLMAALRLSPAEFRRARSDSMEHGPGVQGQPELQEVHVANTFSVGSPPLRPTLWVSTTGSSSWSASATTVQVMLFAPALLTTWWSTEYQGFIIFRVF